MHVGVLYLKNKMIITKLKGGLGNQMFQYAVGRSFGVKYNDETKIDITGYDDPRYVLANTPRTYRMYSFNLKCDIANNEEIIKNKYPFGIFSKALRFINYRVFKNGSIVDYKPTYFKNKHTYIDGYFQSEKNFINVKEEIRKEFKIKKELETEVFVSEKSKIDTNNSVSVHIRRGDYVNEKNTNAYHGTTPHEYYIKAIETINSKVKNPIFYFFSDDIDWVKKEFGAEDNYVFISNPKLQDFEELMLMSYCSHNIIANSSFSWWGAWLNDNPNKIVIAPKKWVNVEPNPHPNILPETWLTI